MISWWYIRCTQTQYTLSALSQGALANLNNFDSCDWIQDHTNIGFIAILFGIHIAFFLQSNYTFAQIITHNIHILSHTGTVLYHGCNELVLDDSSQSTMMTSVMHRWKCLQIYSCSMLLIYTQTLVETNNCSHPGCRRHAFSCSETRWKCVAHGVGCYRVSRAMAEWLSPGGWCWSLLIPLKTIQWYSYRVTLTVADCQRGSCRMPRHNWHNSNQLILGPVPGIHRWHKAAWWNGTSWELLWMLIRGSIVPIPTFALFQMEKKTLENWLSSSSFIVGKTLNRSE